MNNLSDWITVLRIIKGEAAETQPRYDIIVEVGKDLTINCTFDEACATNSSYVHWKVTQLKGKTKTISEFVKPISTLTAQLKIPSVAVEDSGTYVCWPGAAQFNSNNTNVVKIGYKPLENVSLECTSFNLDKLTCTWYAKNSSYLEETTWLLQYRSKGMWKNCSAADTRAYSCTITDGYPTTLQMLTFQLCGNNRLGIKLNEPARIKYSFNSTSVHISWKTPVTEANSSSDILINYKISYRSKWQSAELETNEKEYTLASLIPFTKYSIQISARLQFGSYLNEWSRPVVVELQTNQTAPEEWTALKAGSFQELNIHKNKRSIVLYLKTLELYQHNGENFTYKIFSDQPDTEPIYTIKTYAEITLINLNNSYEFQVSAINNAGETKSVQTLWISNNNSAIPIPAVNDLVNYENGTYMISWNSSDTTLNYTIFWCQTENSKLDEEKHFVHCSSDNSGLNWTDVLCGTTFCQHNVTTNPSNHQYSFAVASKKEQFSNGLVWSDCTISISRTNIPIIRPHVLGTVSTWATISWDVPCKDRTTRIAAFKVYYKSEDIKSSEKEETILHYFGANRREFTLNNLTSGTRYSLQMTAVSSSGLEGKRSGAITIETPISSAVLDETNNQPFIISVSLLCILGCLISLAFFVYKKFYKEKLHLIHNIIQHIPAGILIPNNENKNKYSAARRESDSKFTIQLSRSYLQSAVSVDSNTSGFISDSLESVLTTPTTEEESEEKDNNETNQEKCETQSPQCSISNPPTNYVTTMLYNFVIEYLVLTQTTLL
uniref:Cytokine receptor n=1 Tax=Strigamia maritima TaxID=126957 RepID=T1IU88_STRMM